MAKGIGLIGNFKGKVGNMVGYKNSGSNTANTQGIRVYQPIVKNPKTAAQAEQRAKLAPINATYRALKMVIDRGNEGLPYGNKSRLAWLKQAFHAEHMPWIVKGKSVSHPVGCQLTKGSLTGLSYSVHTGDIEISCTGAAESSSAITIGGVSTLLLAGYPSLKAGDQITIVTGKPMNGTFEFEVFSFILNTSDTTATSSFTADTNSLTYERASMGGFASIIVSREGVNGEHLRSTSNLVIESGLIDDIPYIDDSKTAAIESYMNSAAVNSDWAEESIQ